MKVWMIPTAALGAFYAALGAGAASAQSAPAPVATPAPPSASPTPDEGPWFPSKWGPDDEIGAANLLSPELVLKAIKLVKTGKVYQLGVPIDDKFPAVLHRRFELWNVPPAPTGDKSEGPNKFTMNDELIVAWTGVGTQLNGVGHIGIDHVYYNGHHAKDFVTVRGVKKLGLEKTPPIVTRGILIDMADFYGLEIVPAGTEFSIADITAALKKQGTKIEKGDVVLFHTGWLKLVGRDNQAFLSGEPGIGLDAAKWLADQDIVAFGGDTWASEVAPRKDGQRIPVNQYMVAKRGIYNVELTETSGLARDKVYEFLFVLGHPLYIGATQEIVNPIAIR